MPLPVVSRPSAAKFDALEIAIIAGGVLLAVVIAFAF
jgi:hypothetical protein